MIKKLILPVLILISQAAFSQDLMNKMSKDVCACIEKKTAQGEKLELQQLMQACATEAIMSNMNEFMEKYGDAAQDPKKMEEFGVELGVKLTKECPAFMKAARSSGNNLGTGKGEIVGVEKVLSLEGTVESVKSKGLVTITLVSNGVKEEFIILERFEGSENIFGKEKELKNKRMYIEYKEIEIYNPDKKTFEKQKAIKAVKLK